MVSCKRVLEWAYYQSKGDNTRNASNFRADLVPVWLTAGYQLTTEWPLTSHVTDQWPQGTLPWSCRRVMLRSLKVKVFSGVISWLCSWVQLLLFWSYTLNRQLRTYSRHGGVFRYLKGEPGGGGTFQVDIFKSVHILAYFLYLNIRGVAMGGIYLPKIRPSKLFMGLKWRQNGYLTYSQWILKFYTSPKFLNPPPKKNKYWLCPC